MAIDTLSLHSHEEGPGSHLPRIVSQVGNGHALVSVPFQHSETPMDRTDQFIECHNQDSRPAMANLTGSSTATPR